MKFQIPRFLYYAALVVGFMFLAKWSASAGFGDWLTVLFGFIAAILIYGYEIWETFYYSAKSEKNTIKKDPQ